MARIRRDFVRGLMLVNEFLAFAEDASPLLAAGESVNLAVRPGHYVLPRTGDTSSYGRTMAPAARAAFHTEQHAAATVRIAPGITAVSRERDEPVPTMESLLMRLSTPNLVFREMFDAGVLNCTPTLFNDEFARMNTFNARCAAVLQKLLVSRDNVVPEAVTPTMRTIADQAMERARARNPQYLHAEFATTSAQTKELLIQWLVAFHISKAPAVADPFAVDLGPLIGFSPPTFIREWALNRKERMELVFGTPDLRGPLAAEPVAPRGTYRREDYTASQNELVLATQ